MLFSLEEEEEEEEASRQAGYCRRCMSSVQTGSWQWDGISQSGHLRSCDVITLCALRSYFVVHGQGNVTVV
jgi:hypothetical protein